MEAVTTGAILVQEQSSTLMEIVKVIINGLLTGLGAALGTYLATRVIIRKTERLLKKVKR